MKIRFFLSGLLLLFFMTAKAQEYRFYEFERGLIAHYPLIGNTDDYSGYANHGIVNPAQTSITSETDLFGKENSCMKVTTGASGDYFYKFKIPDFDPLPIETNLGITFRFSPAAIVPNTRTVIISRKNGSNTEIEIGYNTDASGGVRFFYTIGTNTITSPSSHTLVAGNWYFIVANLNNDRTVWYRNNGLIGEIAPTNATLCTQNNCSTSLNKGMSLFFMPDLADNSNVSPIATLTTVLNAPSTTADLLVCGQNFNGRIDAIRYYNRALFPYDVDGLNRGERYEPSTMKRSVPPIAYEMKVYSAWQWEADGTYNGTINRTAVFAQSFKATAPYLKKITINTATCNTSGKVRFEVYPFNTEAEPISKNKKSFLGRPVFSGTGSINGLSVSCDSWDYLPSLKVGSTYIVKVSLDVRNSPVNACTNDNRVHMYFSTRDIYGGGKAYELNTSTNNFVPSLTAGTNTIDMNMEITGGYPVKDTKDLPVMDIWGKSTTSWNRTAASFGQTFLATTPFIKKILYNCGSTTGKAMINIYEYSGNTSNPKGNKVGEHCIVDMVPYGRVWFDWDGTGKAMPMLQVGREYYLEISKADGTGTIHYYGNSENTYSYKGSFGSASNSGSSFTGGTSDGGTDLNLTIVGMDPKLTEEMMFSEWPNPGQSVSASIFKQTFIATTNYVSEVTLGSCYAYTDLQVFIQEESEGLNGNRNIGTYESLYNGIEGSGLRGEGCTYHFRFKYPVRVEIGKKYYLTVKRSSGGSFDLLTKNENLQKYGTRLYKNGAEHLYNNKSTSLCLRMKGLKTGTLYYGPATMANNSDGGYMENFGLRINDFRDELKFTWDRVDVAIDGYNVAYAAGEYSPDVWAFDNKVEEKQKRGGGMLAIISNTSIDNFISMCNGNGGLLDTYLNKIKGFALRYKGRPIIYEIFNEPNGRLTPSCQITLIKSISNAIKSVDPAAQVCIGSWSSVGMNWMDIYQESTDVIRSGVGNNGGYGVYADFMSYHPYWQDLPELGTGNWNFTRRLDFATNSYNFNGTVSAPAIRSIPSFISSEFGVFSPIETWDNIDIVKNDPDDPQGTSEANTNAALHNSLTIQRYNNNTQFKVLKNYYNGSPKPTMGDWQFIRDFIFPKVPIYEIRVGTTNVDFLKLVTSNGTLVPNSDNCTAHYDYSRNMTVFRFNSSYPVELDYDVTYTIKLTKMVSGNLVDVSSQANLFSYGVKKAFIWGEGFCESVDKALIYWERYNLCQLREGVQSSVNYKMSWGDLYSGVFTNNPFGSTPTDNFSLTPYPSAYLMKRYNDLMKNAVNTPHFSMQVNGDFSQYPDILHVAKIDPVRDELIIAIWRTKSATYRYPMTTSLTIASDEFSGEGVVYSRLVDAPYNRANKMTCQQGITRDVSQSGKLILNNIQISERPVYIRIKRKGQTFVLNPLPGDKVNYIEEDCNIGTCKF